MQLLSNPKLLLETKYSQVQSTFDEHKGVLWTLVDHVGVPCFTDNLLSEIYHHHKSIELCGGMVFSLGQLHTIRYSVIASLTPKVFNLGGELSLFKKLIVNNDRKTLLGYGCKCIDAISPRINNFNSSITTIALVQGDALGGGME
ncbi:MAG: enoyl-CoA hydratase, partial [Gallionella sp.]